MAFDLVMKNRMIVLIEKYMKQFSKEFDGKWMLYTQKLNEYTVETYAIFFIKARDTFNNAVHKAN